MKKNYLKTKFVCAFIAFFFTATFSFAQTDVLVCGAQPTQSWIDDVQNKLIATGSFTSVSTFNLYTGTPTLAYLQGFDAVLIFTDYSCQNGVMFGDSLAAYIDGGGGVVNCVFSTASVPIGGAFDSTMYQVVISTDQTDGDTLTLGTILDVCHPIMTGITNINGGPASYRSDTNVVLTPGSAYVANWSNGQWLVAEKLNVGPANARRADLNFFPPSMSVRSDLWDTTSQGGQFMANALLWVAGLINPPVATVSSTSTLLCVDDADAILAGTPAGGTWSGAGVTGITFDPSAPGTGTFYPLYVFTNANGCTVSDSVAITVDVCTAVAEALSVNSMSVYPNPNNGEFVISINANLGDVKIEVLDMQGRVVYLSQENNVAAGFTSAVSLDEMANGMYLVRLTTADEQQMIKVSVQK